MPTLKEIKGRIASVQNTLKITSAMKLVSSAKLRKAQTAIENMLPYQTALQRILTTALASSGADSVVLSTKKAENVDGEAKMAVPSTKRAENVDGEAEMAVPSTKRAENVDGGPGRVAVVAIASNSSLCGCFNATAVTKVKGQLKQYPDAEVYSIGRKMADAMRKAGHPSPADFTSLSEHPAYAPCSQLAEQLMEDFEKGRLSRVFLVYNHYVSTAKQVPTVETFLPAALPEGKADALPADVILEPSARKLLEELLPKAQKLKLYTTLLDSAAAEHAARTVAMQTATDNGEELLEELTLQYNKGRQQKITSEILDLAGGQNN